MDSLVRPRTASPHSPPIKHARSLSPRSVMVEYEFSDHDGDGDSQQELQHLQQPLQDNFDYEDYFRDCRSADNHNNSTPRRPNKRKLLSTDLPPRSVMNLRHRQISNETMEWLSSYSSSQSPSTTTTALHPISDTDDNDESFPTSPQSSLALSSAAPSEKSSLVATSTATVRQPVEELWLGPVFESSQTVLTAIASLPRSVTHLDLDLRNALHLLPQAMPLLFGKHHLKTLSLRVFGDAGAVELAKWMHQNPNLEHLDLRGNRIGSMGARRIVDAIQAGSSSSSNLTRLNLSCNCILHGDMIGELLSVNSTLESLDLGYNWLGNEEVQAICSGLGKNTSLRELNLHGCHRISHTGMKIILRCLQKHNTSLHKIGLQAFDEEGRRLIQEINYWLKLNKAGRYLIKATPTPLVSSSSTQTQQQNQRKGPPTPMGLWPHVLEKSKGDPDCIFHLVREGFGSSKIVHHQR